jgi:hypothetical protein
MPRARIRVFMVEARSALLAFLSPREHHKLMQALQLAQAA